MNNQNKEITWLRFPLTVLVIMQHGYSVVQIPGDHAVYFKAHISQQVILIPRQQWDMCLYLSDRMHLNDKGYEALDSCLTSIININTTN